MTHLICRLAPFWEHKGGVGPFWKNPRINSDGTMIISCVMVTMIISCVMVTMIGNGTMIISCVMVP